MTTKSRISVCKTKWVCKTHIPLSICYTIKKPFLGSVGGIIQFTLKCTLHARTLHEVYTFCVYTSSRSPRINIIPARELGLHHRESFCCPQHWRCWYREHRLRKSTEKRRSVRVDRHPRNKTPHAPSHLRVSDLVRGRGFTGDNLSSFGGWTSSTSINFSSRAHVVEKASAREKKRKFS